VDVDVAGDVFLSCLVVVAVPLLLSYANSKLNSILVKIKRVIDVGYVAGVAPSSSS
jgi:hypothetical protein